MREVNRAANRLPAPGDVDHPAIRKALEAFLSMVAEHRQAEEAIASATRAVEAATVKDREALAASIRAGKSDPGSKALDAANATLEATRRRRDAVEPRG